MHADFEIPVQSEVQCFNGILKRCNLYSFKVLVLICKFRFQRTSILAEFQSAL